MDTAHLQLTNDMTLNRKVWRFRIRVKSSRQPSVVVLPSGSGRGQSNIFPSSPYLVVLVSICVAFYSSIFTTIHCFVYLVSLLSLFSFQSCIFYTSFEARVYRKQLLPHRVVMGAYILPSQTPLERLHLACGCCCCCCCVRVCIVQL